MRCNLQGIGVLVTRPNGQANALCDLIARYGGKPTCFPTIAIEPTDEQALAKKILSEIDSYQIAIFISPNAVKYSLELLGDSGISTNATICAVGKGTAAVLGDNGIEVDITPDGSFDSESLLATPELNQVAGKRILIVRGNGGRRLLGDTLQERGAEIEYAEVYSRSIPVTDPESVLANWEKDVDVVTATSCGILENLFTLLGDKGGDMLRATPLAVVSKRIEALAQERGCRNVILANEASDQGLVLAICEWASTTSR